MEQIAERNWVEIWLFAWGKGEEVDNFLVSMREKRVLTVWQIMNRSNRNVTNLKREITTRLERESMEHCFNWKRRKVKHYLQTISSEREREELSHLKIDGFERTQSAS